MKTKTSKKKQINAGNDMRNKAKNIAPNNFQLSLFQTADPEAAALKNSIKALDINAMTPIECMLKLHELKKILDN